MPCLGMININNSYSVTHLLLGVKKKLSTTFTLPSFSTIAPAQPSADFAALDPSSTRLSSLNFPSAAPSTPIVTLAGAPMNDKRVRIAMLPGSPPIFYKDMGNPLLYNYLGATNGVLFPFQPKVDISFSANYQAQKVTQSNFAFYSYENSELKPFDLTCDFPVRNPFEGQYVIAAITFLRSLTMMFTGNDNNFGNNGLNLAGSPPLVVSLQGMGFGGLDYIPVVVTNVTTSYRDDVDYVTITLPGVANLANETIKLPTMMTISVSCTPMFSRAFASQFSALDFSTGARRLLGPAGAASARTGADVTVNAGDLPTVETATATLSDFQIQEESVQSLGI